MINKKFLMAAGIFILVFCILSGCEKKRTKEELILLPVETNVETGTAKAETVEKEEAETNAQKNDRLQEDADSAITEEAYVVHICGAVENPGIYMLEAGSRIYQAIDAAGGLCEDAAGDYLNQADTLTDGMKIYVTGNEERIVLSSQFDNLGKGASGAAIECMNLVLGCEEDKGLQL